MTQPVRRPSFLSPVAGEPCARSAAFPFASDGVPRREPPPPPPEAPTAAQLAAARADAMERVAHAVEVLRLQADRLAEEARADALEVGFQVARRILQCELQTGPEPLFALVRSAVQRAGESRRIVVRLHPEDAALVQEALKGRGAGIASSPVKTREDPSLARGDCVVETDFGQVDGRLSTRLEELHRAAAAGEGAP